MKKDDVKVSRQSEPSERILHRGLYITIKTKEELDAKRIIAEHVVREYVHDFDAVLLDAGSTVEIVAEEMFKQRKFLSVLTNNMGAYAAYIHAGKIADGEKGGKNPPNQGNELLISGGRYVDVYESLLGSGAISSIESFTPNVVILGTSGLRCEEGIFCHGSEESAVKSLLWTKPTDTRLIVTDWTKIGKRDASAFGRVSDFRLNAKRAVIVTNMPPRELCIGDSKKIPEQMSERIKEFREELDLMERMGIKIDKVQIETRPSEEEEAK